MSSASVVTTPETTSVYLWIDYLSIPQQNKVLQGLSISSLAVYASICRYFIMVAPPARHVDADKDCSAATYQRRGWCAVALSILRLKASAVVHSRAVALKLNTRPVACWLQVSAGANGTHGHRWTRPLVPL